MPEFSVNPQRFDPYKNFKFRVKWDGRYVAGVSQESEKAIRVSSSKFPFFQLFYKRNSKQKFE
jgi:hypothetical protein